MKAKNYHVVFQELDAHDHVTDEHKFELVGVWSCDVEIAIINRISRMKIKGWAVKKRIALTGRDGDKWIFDSGKRRAQVMVTENLFGGG